MQKSDIPTEHVKRIHIEAMTKATIARERSEKDQASAVYSARSKGITWAEIADATSKGSAAAAASYFGDSATDRSAKRAAARERSSKRINVAEPAG